MNRHAGEGLGANNKPCEESALAREGGVNTISVGSWNFPQRRALLIASHGVHQMSLWGLKLVSCLYDVVKWILVYAVITYNIILYVVKSSFL